MLQIRTKFTVLKFWIQWFCIIHVSGYLWFRFHYVLTKVQIFLKYCSQNYFRIFTDISLILAVTLHRNTSYDCIFYTHLIGLCAWKLVIFDAITLTCKTTKKTIKIIISKVKNIFPDTVWVWKRLVHVCVRSLVRPGLLSILCMRIGIILSLIHIYKKFETQRNSLKYVILN